MSQMHSGHRERMRKQYTEHGADSFHDHQLLELLLTYAIPRRDTNETAHHLLDRFGSLENVLRADILALCTVPGIGPSTALFLHMQGDLLQRVMMRRLEEKPGRIRLLTPADSARFSVGLLFNEPYESVYMVCLNSQRVVQCTRCLSVGTLNEAPVYPRTIVETALLQRAFAVVLVHNHPSGSVLPSDEDRETTQQVSTALSSIGIRLLDHLIAGGPYAYSFSANAVMLVRGPVIDTLTVDDYVKRSEEVYAASEFVRERACAPYELPKES